MCLLTYLPAGVLPDTDALAIGAEINDDGHGFAIVAGTRLIVRRGMDAAQTIAEFDAARRRYPHGPALFHSRLSTAGDRSVDNCHPFAVGGDSRTVLAHNGVLPGAVQPLKGDRRSDTRITAEEFLPAFGSLRLRRARLRFERWLTPSNKIVVLTVDSRFKRSAYLFNEASGTWHDGIWYSNSGYRRQAGAWWDDEAAWTSRDWHLPAATDLRCPVCRTHFGAAAWACPCCGWCPDCGELPGDCLCYPPAVLDRRLGAAGTG